MTAHELPASEEAEDVPDLERYTQQVLTSLKDISTVSQQHVPFQISSDSHCRQKGPGILSTVSTAFCGSIPMLTTRHRLPLGDVPAQPCRALKDFRGEVGTAEGALGRMGGGVSSRDHSQILTSVHRIPGEQSWARPSVLLESPENVTASSLTTSTGQPLLPNAVHSKYPLPGRGGDYLGALIKVCMSSWRCAELNNSHRFTTKSHIDLRRRILSSGSYHRQRCPLRFPRIIPKSL